MASVKSEFLPLTPEGEIVKPFKKASVKRQYFAVICLDLLAFSFGATCGWASAGISILKSENTPLETGPITTTQASYVASGIGIGGFFGNFIFGWVRIF